MGMTIEDSRHQPIAGRVDNRVVGCRRDVCSDLGNRAVADCDVEAVFELAVVVEDACAFHYEEGRHCVSILSVTDVRGGSCSPGKWQATQC